MYTRLPYLQKLIEETDPNIICIQESKLRANKNIRLKHYQHPPARKDREIEGGGGVMIFVKQGLPYTEEILETSMEAAAIKIYLREMTLSVVSLYIPPDYKNKTVGRHLEQLVKQLERPFLLCMDANAHHTAWGSEVPDRRGQIIEDWLTRNELGILNSGGPTYMDPQGKGSQIDITMCTEDLSTRFSWEVHHDLCTSDHFPIYISSAIEAPEIQGTLHWGLQTADWQCFQSLLDLENIDMNGPTQACEDYTTKIIHAATLCIKQTGSNPRSRHCNGWWNEQCAVSRREKIEHYQGIRDIEEILHCL